MLVSFWVNSQQEEKVNVKLHILPFNATFSIKGNLPGHLSKQKVVIYNKVLKGVSTARYFKSWEELIKLVLNLTSLINKSNVLTPKHILNWYSY